ncbi:MAG: GNAT family N-acetyltransferase [Ruminococcus sp.]|nr:GNAT family N-acetyltransferase [Ruminococcus sp.]
MEDEKLPETEFAYGYEAMSDDQNHVILVAELNGQVVGTLHMRMEYQLHHAARIAEIMELAVLDGFRSQGIGRQLLAAASETARKCLCEQLEVGSHKKRVCAHRFYQRESMKKTHDKFTLRLMNAKCDFY